MIGVRDVATLSRRHVELDERDLRELARSLSGPLLTPGPLQALAFDHPNEFSYPLVMIPTFAVPLSLILHGLSLRQIARRKARTDHVGMLSQIPA